MVQNVKKAIQIWQTDGKMPAKRLILLKVRIFIPSFLRSPPGEQYSPAECDEAWTRLLQYLEQCTRSLSLTKFILVTKFC
jgi:hypothetical protein